MSLLQWCRVYVCGKKTWYLFKEQSHCVSQQGLGRKWLALASTTLLADLSPIEAQGWEHWLTWAGDSITFLPGSSWDMSVCVSVLSYSCCCAPCRSVRNPLPQAFCHGWTPAWRGSFTAMMYYLATCQLMIAVCIAKEFPTPLQAGSPQAGGQGNKLAGWRNRSHVTQNCIWILHGQTLRKPEHRGTVCSA